MAPPSPAARTRALVALAAARSTGAILARVSLAVGALSVLLGVLFALVVGKRAPGSLDRVPLVASSALAWGAGVLLAFASAAHGLIRDRDEGLRALLVQHGHAPSAYVVARAAGLALALFAIVGGGSLATGLACVLAASDAKSALACAQSTLATCVYSAAFSAIVAPVSLAALGARSRAGGYAWLLLVLFAPELVSRATGALVPEAWSKLVSIPGALAALRGALAPPGVDGPMALRAGAVLTVATAIALVALRVQLLRVDAALPHEETAP
jgi:hypothetical protein